MYGAGFSGIQCPLPGMSRAMRPRSIEERYPDWPTTAPLPLGSPEEKEARCSTLLRQKLQSLWQALNRRLSAMGLKKKASVTELMLLPLGPASRKPVSRNANPLRFGAPTLYKTRQIPIPQRINLEKKVAVVDESNGHELELSQYGNLSEHGAFWLKNVIGLTLGTLGRSRAPQRIGNTVPVTFYALDLDVPYAIRHTDTGEAIAEYLLQEAMQQARKANLRLLIKPESAQQRKDYKQLGFVSLEKALQRYVPRDQSNRPPRDMQGWLAYDGFLVGYPRERIASVQSL